MFGSVTKVRLGGGDDENEKLRVEGTFIAGRKGSWVLTGRCGCPGTCNGIPDKDSDGIPDDQDTDDGRRARANTHL